MPACYWDKLLAVAMKDTLWGIGLPPHHKDILNTFTWTSDGWMSKVLMKIKHENPLPSSNNN